MAESAIEGGGPGPGAGYSYPSVYRQGGSNPGNLTPRAGEQGISTRDSLTNPIVNGAGERIPGGARPVMEPGRPYIEIDTSKLPPGSVIKDGYPYGNMPAGHVVGKGKFP